MHEMSDDSFPADEQIRRFNEEYGDLGGMGGWGEELANCTRIVETMIRTDTLTKESLLKVFGRARESVSIGTTFHVAYRTIEAAAKQGKLSAEVLGIVEESVMADEDPLWSKLGMQEKENTRIIQRLLTNPYLFELMLPYISPDEFEDNLNSSQE